MRRWRRRGLLLLLWAALTMGITGLTQAAFTSQTASTGNNVTTAPDWLSPTIGSIVIGKSAGGATGAIRPGVQYYVYANVTDSGNPASGVASATADVSSVSPGQTTAPLTAGTYTAGGVTYNYRTNLLTAGTVASGRYAFSVRAVDAAGNPPTVAGGSVAVDTVAPRAIDIQAFNGNVLGSVDEGDTVVYTFSEPIDPDSILAGWSGATTPISAQLRNGGGTNGDRLDMLGVNLGTLGLGRGDMFVGRKISYTATMTLSGSTITIVMGPPGGTPGPSNGPGTLTWTPSASVLDPAGNPMSVTPASESGAPDRDF
jgi:hypothetical protein